MLIKEKNYTFNLQKHPAKKGTCPNCNTKNSFRYYEGLSLEYGICDRVNNCGYHNNPGNLSETNKKDLYNMVNATVSKKPETQTKSVYPTNEQLTCLSRHTSPFHVFCKEALKIPDEHFKLWNIGTRDPFTEFAYQNIQGRVVNIVSIEYLTKGNNVKRNKERFPFSLKANKGEKYSLCLFGEHLLQEGKIVCLVESEKTAFIASHFYPQFNWIATGGANKLTDEKIDVLFNRRILYLNDADRAGKENSTIRKLKAYKLDFEVIDLFPDRNDGYDLADAIIEGLRPEIKQKETHVTNAEQPGTQTKNISEFEKVERFITDRYEIRNNIVSNKIECRPKTNPNAEFEDLNENNIFRELQKNFINFSINKLKSLLASDFVPEYDPFKDYFQSLQPWDEKIDYISKLTEYIPVKDKARLQTQFKKALVRSVACSFGGNVNKQALILVHDMQNSGKSTFCRWLCPPQLSKYIAENITTDKDSLIAMCTNFIINMDELATLNKAEINALKAVMSKDVFKGRLPYGAREVFLKRRANILGSTNKTEFLSDETGSVRWLCFELTGKINFAYKTDIAINQVWAQAFSLYKSGFKYELTPEEITENEAVNAEYRITTTEQELIQAKFIPSSKNSPGAMFKTATDIKILLADLFPSEKLNNIINIGRALKVLGYEKVTVRDEQKGIPIKGYYIMNKP